MLKKTIRESMVYLLLQGNGGPSLFKGMVDPFHLKMIDLFYLRWFAALLKNSEPPFANFCLARSLPSSPPNQAKSRMIRNSLSHSAVCSLAAVTFWPVMFDTKNVKWKVQAKLLPKRIIQKSREHMSLLIVLRRDTVFIQSYIPARLIEVVKSTSQGRQNRFSSLSS